MILTILGLVAHIVMLLVSISLFKNVKGQVGRVGLFMIVLNCCVLIMTVLVVIVVSRVLVTTLVKCVPILWPLRVDYNVARVCIVGAESTTFVILEFVRVHTVPLRVRFSTLVWVVSYQLFVASWPLSEGSLAVGPLVRACIGG